MLNGELGFDICPILRFSAPVFFISNEWSALLSRTTPAKLKLDSAREMLGDVVITGFVGGFVAGFGALLSPPPPPQDSSISSDSAMQHFLNELAIPIVPLLLAMLIVRLSNYFTILIRITSILSIKYATQ
jgi:hypothetical protein